MCSVTGTAGGGLVVNCQRVTLGTNDGKICGSSGSSDCSKQCKDSACVSTAPDGAACRPSGVFGADICDGQCKAGVCVALLDSEKCPDNKIGDCTYDFCDAKKSTACTKYNLPKGYSCNDMASCTTGDVCDGAGKCAGTPKVCPTSTANCKVATCDPSTATGACVDKNAPAGTACRFDKCFAGQCDSAGTCLKGAAVSCDDGDPCTTDTCDATAGCQHTPISGCGVVDAGPVDTGTVDTGTPPMDTGTPPVDTGTPPVDTGTVPIDTGVVVTDTGTPPIEDTGSTVEDTGSIADDTGSVGGDTGTTSGSDAAEDDAALGIETTVEPNTGCGCRTTSSSPSYGALSLAALGLIVARKRRGLRR